MSITFDTLGLPQPVANTLAQRGLVTMTPLQRQLLPPALSGLDAVGVAPLGSGKTTAALLVGATCLLTGNTSLSTAGPRVLILAPTHESASHTADTAKSLLRQMHAVTEQSDVIHLRSESLGLNTRVVIADPPTTLAHFQRGALAISDLQLVVLDDVSLAMSLGFASDLYRLFRAMPRYRQTLAFCRAQSNDVQAMARQFMRHPQFIETAPPAPPPVTAAQRVIPVMRHRKVDILIDWIRTYPKCNVMLWVRNVANAERLITRLVAAGIKPVPLFGAVSDDMRAALAERLGRSAGTVVVATSDGTREVQWTGVLRIINVDVPADPYEYAWHARQTVDVCTLAAVDEAPAVRAIERSLGQALPRTEALPPPLQTGAN